MDKNRQRGNIVFFVGVLIFAAAFIVGWLTDVSAVIIDLVMGLGLIIEFVGICFCYKKEDANVEDKDEKAEVKALKEEKIKIEEEKTDDVIEVEKPVKETKTTTKKTTAKKNTSKKTTGKKSTKKASNKKSSSTKKNTTGKKKTTKKNSTKKTTK